MVSHWSDVNLASWSKWCLTAVMLTLLSWSKWCLTAVMLTLHWLRCSLPDFSILCEILTLPLSVFLLVVADISFFAEKEVSILLFFPYRLLAQQQSFSSGPRSASPFGPEPKWNGNKDPAQNDLGWFPLYHLAPPVAAFPFLCSSLRIRGSLIRNSKLCDISGKWQYPWKRKEFQTAPWT